MKINLYSFLILNILFAKLGFAQSDKAQQPNIVFILADDLGYMDLGTYGQTKIQTPHIDALAKKGLKFTDFYAGTSVCAPSRASLMSGQHTGHTHIRGNKEIEPEGQEPLADSVTTIAMLLKNAGYVTGAFGKWGLGMVGTSGDPNHKGFDEFFGYNCQRQSHTFYPDHLWHNDRKVLFENNRIAKKYYAPELIQEKTLEFIEKNKNNPFFLFVPTTLPHAELAGPQDSIYMQYANAFEETPYVGNHYASTEKPRAMFASMVSRMDAYVGQIIAKIEALGLDKNTIIIFTSDNGAHKEGGADPDFFQSSGNLRGLKRSLYEGGIRVPFIVSWANKIPSNSTTNTRGAFWDIMPTLVQLAQTDQIGYTDGKSLLNDFINPTNDSPNERTFYWEFHEEGGRQALLQGDWKLIIQQAKDPNKRYFELFNLKNDPTESINLANEKPEIIQSMFEEMAKQRTENSIFPFHKQ